MPTTLQDQYAEFAKRGQEASFAVVDAWTRTIQDASVQVPSVSARAAANQVIDQVFDFAGTVLAVQRKFAKDVVSSSADVAEDVAGRAQAAATEVGNTVKSTTAKARTSAQA